MRSLYDELSERLKNDTRPAHRAGPRADVGLLLFSNRDALHDLWMAAERVERLGDAEAQVTLHNAVERLRPLFGERKG